MLAEPSAYLSDPERLVLNLDRAEYEDSLYAFLRAAWRYIDPAPWVDGWPIEAVAEHLEAVADGEIKRLLINIPPRSGKTSLFSIAFPAWVWAQSKKTPTCGPETQFMYASYAEKRSLQDSVKCRQLIRSAFYQGFWGGRFSLLDDQDTKHRFTNDKGGHRLVTSIGGTSTGEGAMICAADDPNATNEALSEAATMATLDWWDTTFRTRVNDPKHSVLMVVQQRCAENDLSGHILEKDRGEWTHLMLPMKYEPDRSFTLVTGWKDPREVEGQLLWPERFGPKEVTELERDIGPWATAGQLQQRPEPKGGGIINRDWWVLFEDEKFPPMDYIMASLDTAYTEKTENDYSALTVWGVFTTDSVAQIGRMPDHRGRLIPMERVYNEGHPKVLLMFAWQQRLSFPDLVREVLKDCRKLKVDKLLIENKAAGISTAQEIRRLMSSEEFSVELCDPKNLDKVARLYSVQHLFAEGIIHAPDRAWADQVITQVSQFPRSRHDDLTDSASMAIRYLRDYGFMVRGPERLQEIEDAKRYEGRAPEPLYPA